jgi:P2-related tail formation protein
LDAYFEPSTAPQDFLEWLASWVGLMLDENTPTDRQRAVVAQTVELYRARGTIAGLHEHLELLTGGKVVIADSGGVSYSVTPGGDLPGEDTPRLAVRVITRAGEDEVFHGLDELVASSKPAHVIHQVEVASS